MGRDSSDDEDDREALIEQNDRKTTQNDNHRIPIPNSAPSSFHIEDFPPAAGGPIRRRFFRSLNKRYYWYLLAIFLPLVIVVLYFSIDVRNLFSSGFSSLRIDSASDRMREAELEALYLLGQQQISLASLFNQSNLVSNSISNSSLDFRSEILKQISLNNQIQKALLSPHKISNANVSDESNGVFGVFGYDSCRKVELNLANRKTIEWKPRSDKFLFPICLSGQMSNHLICLEKHMFFAALLNRVMVMPSSKFDYPYYKVLDIEHINECLGRKVVITFEEFTQLRKNHVHIDKFICYFSAPDPCYMDEEHVKRLKALGVSMGKLESPWKEDAKKPSQRTVQDVLDKFLSNEDVIAVGDLFYADVDKDWIMQPGGPLAHKCKAVIEPSRLILLTAQRFVQTFLGKNFISLHFRRHGFLKFCNAKNPSCFYPIPQAAECISRIVERVNAPVIYLSTDAADSETELLQSLIVHNGKPVPLVRRPSHTSVEKWDALLSRHGLEGDSQVEAMLDKTISALANVFIGASGSTFTEDILRLRKDWGTSSLCDEYLCQGELPNFIAEDE